MTALTLEKLRGELSYDPESGIFRRAIRTSTRIKVGDVAGCPNEKGYLLIRIGNTLYRAHRLAWFYIHGCWPSCEIDHIDGDRKNNSISNLREASHAENMQNLAKKKTNKSGFTGVRLIKDGKWKAEISVNGRNKSLGIFTSPEDASNAYNAAKRAAHTFNPIAREI